MVALVALVLWSGCAALNRPEPTDISIDAGDFSRGDVEARNPVRVVTFNVHGESAASITRGLRRSRPLGRADIILLQEIDAHGDEPESETRRIARALGMAFVYAPGYGLSDGGSHGVAILARWPLSDVTLIELPRYDVHVNSGRRVAIGVTLSIGGAPVRVYNVHLDNRINPSERLVQLAPVFRDAAERGLRHVLVGGDFNTSPFCWIAHLLPFPCGMQTRCVERFARSQGFDTPVTESGGTAKWLAMRLDGVYTRGLQVVAFAVDDDTRLSDHLPLWLDVVVVAGARVAP